MSEDQKVIVGYANTFHDPAVAVLHKDAVFAEGIERPAQVKRALWMPGVFHALRALRKGLQRLGAPVGEASDIIIRTTWSPGVYFKFGSFYASLFRWLAKVAHKLDIQGSAAFVGLVGFSQVYFLKQLTLFTDMWASDLWKGKARSIRTVQTPHHVAHAANAVYTSQFDECAVMVLDGSGEMHASSFFHFDGTKLRPISATSNQHSLGFLYATVTRACGFSPLEGEEWKVMGLAAYGKERSDLHAFFRDRTRIKGLDVQLRFTRDDVRVLEKLVGGFRDTDDTDILRVADLAHNFQRYFSDVVCELAGNFASRGISKNLAYGGGCALNSSTNGEIVRRSGFSALHVPSAPGDDGNALGVVLYERYHGKLREQPARMSPYLGTALDVAQIERILAFGGLRYDHCQSDDELTETVARLLAEGHIIGWMQGRAEFGPRALGNRSIIADPRQKDMKDKINARVKFREEYRPLAPSVLEGHGERWFVDHQESPYMERTLHFRPEVREQVPAVVHLDGTGRLQTVYEAWNPLYAQLIARFNALTGVPIVLNTSLNVMGKPIVHGVEDAITLFFTTGLDKMVIGPYVLHK